MIDIHSHLLFNLDDGAKNIEESIKILEELNKVGITHVFATTHYKQEIYEPNKEDYVRKLKELNIEANKLNLDIKVLPGNEIKIFDDMIYKLNNKEINTLNNSKYVLIELPMNFPAMFLEDTIIELQNEGYVPIIAHPERYTYIQKNPFKLLQLIDMGVLFQLNLGSLIGKYGIKAEKTAITLLKHNMVHFLATDAHKSENLCIDVQKAIKIAEKIIGKEMLDYLTDENPRLVLNNENILIYEPIKQKKLTFFNV